MTAERDQPTTEAGRRLLVHERQVRFDIALHANEPGWEPPDTLPAAILAIEREAAEKGNEAAYELGWDEARADLAARIEARLRAEPTPPRLYALSAWDLDCVLDAIKKASDDRRA